MSDASSAQRGMAEALNYCPGGPGCSCAEPSGHSSPASSASRSSASIRSDGNSGNSTADTASFENSDSEGDSDGPIPIGVPVQEWSGLSTIRVGKCEHGRRAILKKCWGGPDTARRFLGCPVKDVAQQCDFLEWLDEPWPERVQAAFKKLWRQLKITRDVQAVGHTAMVDAYKCFEAEKKDKEKLKEEVDRTKKMAEEACTRFHRKAVYATMDKRKLMYLIYCLLGVIVFLVVFIIVKM